MKRELAEFILLLITVDITTAAIFNSSIQEVKTNDINDLVALPKDKQFRKSFYPVHPQSTSSSQEKKHRGGEPEAIDSLQDSITFSETDTELDKKKGKRKKKEWQPQSSKERTGWRKWHRKCTKCPEDMRKKWRDPSIRWICGAYQRARRSFKSTCMMYYRNCQDGTMFTKISDRRCQNSSGDIQPHGEHFFYDYKVHLSQDSPSSSLSSYSDEDMQSTSWSVSDERENLERWEREHNETLTSTTDGGKATDKDEEKAKDKSDCASDAI